MFLREKPPDTSEIILEFVKKQTNAFVNIMQSFIITHTIEILALLILIAISGYIIIKLWQGRISFKKIFNWQKEGNSINVLANATRGNNGNTIKQIPVIDKPQMLKKSTDIPTWKETLDPYVGNYSAERKSYINVLLY
jgi:hypothetical protein